MTSYFPYGDPYAGYPPPPPVQPQRPKRGRTVGAGVAGLVAGAVVTGLVLANVGSGGTVLGAGSVSGSAPAAPGTGSSGGGSVNPGQLIPGSVNGGGNAASSATLATRAQQQGIVTIVSVLEYQNAESAGTGLVLTSNGEILTNNHVIDGATSITVRIAASGKAYRADVVGTDATDDVAVLQLRNAAGLTTANLGSAADAAVGDQVVGVGNAGGTGTLRASSGKITALGQSITASDGSGQDAERLTGLIQTDAPIISGDSGGPLYNSSDEVIGIDTAASVNRTTNEAGYAIPIGTAVALAHQIESGVATSKIHIGLPAFLGVGLDPQQTSRAIVSSLLPAGPAAGAGITRGSVITAVNGTHVTTAASLKTALHQHKPGDKVSIHWRDATGNTHTATVTLATGPAD